VKKNITVDKAILVGDLVLRYVLLILMLCVFGFILYLEVIEVMTIWLRIILYISAFALPSLCYFFMVTKWRIWPFSNVRNVHELKKSHTRTTYF
jgi:hypothetical protein